MLAGLVLRDQGIDVEWVTFETPFFTAAKARKASAKTGIALTVKPIYPVYMKMLKNPPAGYGKQMNPCMDCHTLMFKLAGEMMQEQNFDFLFSGEVLGQRPMSQTKSSLQYVEKHSGFKGYILRPLSAKKLPETIPEKEGRVDRERLLDFAGRGRRPQIALAQKYGLTDYPAPAGGCLLTDEVFSRRLRDLFSARPTFELREIELLKLGRHFRIGPNTKLVVGRNSEENQAIQAMWKETDLLLRTVSFPGPTVLALGHLSPELEELAASVTVSYSDAGDSQLTEVSLMGKGMNGVRTAKGRDKDGLRPYMI